MSSKLSCGSCGRPLAGGVLIDPVTKEEFCKDCVDNGKLKTYETIKGEMIEFYMENYSYPRKAAERFVIEQLKQMPAWEKRTEW